MKNTIFWIKDTFAFLHLSTTLRETFTYKWVNTQNILLFATLTLLLIILYSDAYIISVSDLTSDSTLHQLVAIGACAPQK
jgi:hypothetical protein